MSKGSNRRPCQVSMEQYYENYDRVFGKPKRGEVKVGAVLGWSDQTPQVNRLSITETKEEVDGK